MDDNQQLNNNEKKNIGKRNLHQILFTVNDTLLRL